MDTIHSMSSIAPLPEFDLWGVPPTQITVERVLDSEYRPVTNVDASSPLVFHFSSAADKYIKLDKIAISWKVQLKFTKEDKSAITAGNYGQFNFINYAFHSMIKLVEFEIENKQISNLPQNYAYCAFIEALLGFSKNAKKTHLAAAF